MRTLGPLGATLGCDDVWFVGTLGCDDVWFVGMWLTKMT